MFSSSPEFSPFVQAKEIEELRSRMMKENLFLNSLHKTNMSVYFNAYRCQIRN